MGIIYLSEGTLLRKYTATTTGQKSVVKIEIAVANAYALGHLLRELADLENEQKAAEKPKPKAAKKPLALPAPLLKLAYHGGGDE